MSEKPERDWVKEPYNTWDTLAAMRVSPMNADKEDIARLEKKLDRILELLERLVTPITSAMREGHYGPGLQQAMKDHDTNG